MQGTSSRSATHVVRLSPRQREVLALLERGLYYKEIAATLGISHSTVKKHCGKIFARLDADNSREALWKFRYLEPPADRPPFSDRL